VRGEQAIVYQCWPGGEEEVGRVTYDGWIDLVDSGSGLTRSLAPSLEFELTTEVAG